MGIRLPNPGEAHINGVIHGAVLPEHLLIHPEFHGLVLIDWTCAVTPGWARRSPTATA